MGKKAKKKKKRKKNGEIDEKLGNLQLKGP